MHNYTEEQKNIIESQAEQLRVIASPGSGKTTVVVGRIVDLIKRAVPAEKIFVICFAKHDKKNIISRLSKMLPFFVINKVQINNHHSYGLSLIRKNGLFGKSGDEIKLLEESESTALVRKYLEKIYARSTSTDEECQFLFKSAKQLGIVGDVFKLFNLIRDEYCVSLSEVSNKLGQPNYENMTAEFDNLVKEIEKKLLDFDPDTSRFDIHSYKILTKEDLVYLAESYGKYCEKHGYVDFMDMILQPYLMLNRNPRLLEQASENILECLVDEFQDISFLQFQLVSILTKKHNRVFAVGDIDQCLYEWRNAKPYLMKDELPRRYKNLVTLPLSINFRSDANVVNVATKLILHNKERLDLTMKPFFPTKEPVVLRKTVSVMDQAEEIAKLVESTLKSKDNYYVEGDHKVAIIVRSARSVSAHLIRTALFKRQIPVQLRFESKIIEKILSLVCSLCNLTIDPKAPGDLISVLTILPGFGEKTLDKLRSELEEGNDLVTAATNAKLPKAKLEVLKDFRNYVRAINQDYNENNNITVGNLNFFKKEFHLANYLRKSFSQGKDYLENTSLIDSSIEEISNSTDKFIDYRDTLAAGLSALNRPDNERKPAVLLCTAHHAKGGEWETVICPDLVLGGSGYPVGRKIDDEQERRTMYVALTRAMKKLYVFFYSLDIQRSPVAPSPYIREMGLSLNPQKELTALHKEQIAKFPYAENPLFKKKRLEDDYE
jgi:DNA helicase-2/ATP-dependent DNA helicase PcrA